jgi:CO dehydrogenase/acetyl-CoA synthase beta subunit
MKKKGENEWALDENNKVVWIDKEHKNRMMSDIPEEVWVNIDTHIKTK